MTIDHIMAIARLQRAERLMMDLITKASANGRIEQAKHFREQLPSIKTMISQQQSE